MQNRITWTDEMVKQKIMEVVNYLEINRMPTFREIDEYFKDSRLSNKISKTGGIHNWAEILNLPIKEGESQLGFEVELKTKEILENKGFSCELTSTRHPYDILVNGCVKIDVKSARITRIKDSCMYSFGLSKSHHTCDIYIAACLDENKEIEKIFVIPAHIMKGKTQLTIGVEKTKYHKYLERWDFVSEFYEMFKKIS